MTRACPACGEQILVVQSSRHGGTLEAYDPEPSLQSGHYDTMLSPDLSYITGPAARTVRLRGKVEMYRWHGWHCDRKVPAGHALPNIGGYSHQPQKVTT